MSDSGAWAVLVGTTLGIGLWSVVAALPHFTRAPLHLRIAPYVTDVSPDARHVASRSTAHPVPLIATLLRPDPGSAIARALSLLGTPETLALRLRRAGKPGGVDRFRIRQLVWISGGAVIGSAAGLIILPHTAVPTALTPLLLLAGAAAALAANDWMLRRAERSRRAQLAAELPTIMEFLTLSLSSGESLGDAIARVARTGTGGIATELRAVVSDVGAGQPLAQALIDCAHIVHVPAFTRCVEQIVGALDRGTPLSAVLHAQVHDTRSEAKAALIEAAGKKDVLMLIPLVFLILPTTILFAIFPGIFVLQVGF